MTKSWRLTVIMGDRGLYMQTKKGCLSKICRLGSQAVLLWDPPNPRGEPFLAQPLTNCQGSPFPHHDTEKMLAVGRSRSLALQGQRWSFQTFHSQWRERTCWWRQGRQRLKMRTVWAVGTPCSGNPILQCDPARDCVGLGDPTIQLPIWSSLLCACPRRSGYTGLCVCIGSWDSAAVLQWRHTIRPGVFWSFRR